MVFIQQIHVTAVRSGEQRRGADDGQAEGKAGDLRGDVLLLRVQKAGQRYGSDVERQRQHHDAHELRRQLRLP